MLNMPIQQFDSNKLEWILPQIVDNLYQQKQYQFQQLNQKGDEKNQYLTQIFNKIMIELIQMFLNNLKTPIKQLQSESTFCYNIRLIVEKYRILMQNNKIAISKIKISNAIQKSIKLCNNPEYNGNFKFETDFRELFKILDNKKQIINPLQLVINTNIEADNPEVLFYVLSDQMRRTKRSFFKSLQSDKRLMQSFYYLFTPNSKDLLTYILTLQETKTLSYNQIVSDDYFREQFQAQIISSLSICLKVQKNQIKIIALEMGSIKVIFELIDATGTVHFSENLQELQKQFPGTQPVLQLHNYFKKAALSINDFASNHNMDWEKQVFGNYVYRGPKGRTQPYFFPIGWKGFGLNIAGRYGVNDNWLTMDNNQEEWYVMFHGTQFEAVKNIINTGFKLGIAQGFEDDLCLITKKKIGKGVYFTNHIEVCEGFSEPTLIGNQSFLLAFQTRVRPDALRQCQKPSDIKDYLDYYKKNNQFINPSLNDMKLWDNDYFLINEPCDIRPYRILLKKVKT